MKKQKNSFKLGFKYHNKNSAFDGSEFELSWNQEDEESNFDIRYQLSGNSNQDCIEEDTND